jgi:hypothetical protein
MEDFIIKPNGKHTRFTVTDGSGHEYGRFSSKSAALKCVIFLKWGMRKEWEQRAVFCEQCGQPV